MFVLVKDGLTCPHLYVQCSCSHVCSNENQDLLTDSKFFSKTEFYNKQFSPTNTILS